MNVAQDNFCYDDAMPTWEAYQEYVAMCRGGNGELSEGFEPIQIWKTANGKIIPIAKMTSEHLCNAIRYLERLRDRETLAGYSVLGMLNGEQAIYQVEQNLRQMEERSMGELYPVYDSLVEEAEKRGLGTILSDGSFMFI